MVEAMGVEAGGIVVAERRGPLGTLGLAASGVTLATAPFAFRVSLRAREEAVAPLSAALGLDLPRRRKTSTQNGTRAALWLGPDEWLVIDEARDPLLDCRSVEALHSAVDISHRNAGIIVSGAHAVDAISGGCPQNLLPEVFPVGACSRTVLGKIEIVLWRTAEEEYRVECWRSFSAYAFALLSAAARDAAA